MERMLSIGVLLTVAWAASGGSLKPAGADRFFVTPGEPAVLRWTVGAGGVGEPVEFTVRDTWGGEAARGRAKVADDAVEAAVTLGPGFYDIEFPAAKQRFGIVSLPAFGGEADPFFCIDGALSWLVRDDAVREGLVKALRRSGVGMERERVSWAQISPAAGKWDWETSRHYETLRRCHQAEGVAVLEMFHDAPAWAGKVELYPADLVNASRAWGEIAKRWRPTWGALEVWNEPEILFGAHLPADQYVPLVKAIAWAFAQGKIDCPLVGGVFAHYNRRYLDNAARNGLLESVHVASFHTYGRAPQMEGLVGRYRDWLRAHGKQSMPLWLTECGRPWKRGPERPPADQDAASALDIVMKAVEARACGVARYFAFVYPYYDERQNNFGMMGKRATPLRSMAAYAQLARVLAGTRYLGDLAHGDRSIQRARVFGDDRQTLAVLYTGRPDPKATAKLGLPIKRLEGIDGRPLEAAADGSIPIPDGLLYAWLDGAKLGDRLRADTRAMQLGQLAHQQPPTPQAPSPIVLRYQLDRGAVGFDAKGYRIKAVPPGKVSLAVRAFNLSGEARELTLTLALSRQEARVVGEASRTLAVPAEGFADATWQVDVADAFATADWLGATVTAAGEGVGRVLPLALDFTGEPAAEQVLARYAKPVPLPIDDLAAWRRNIVGDGKMTMTRTPEGHWRLEATFGEGDPWVYPYFTLPKRVDLRRAAALVLQARCQGPATVRIFLWEGDTGVGYLAPTSIIPADGKWHTATVRFADLRLSTANRPDPNHRLDLGTVRKISIGLNSLAKRNTLEVRAAHLVGQAEQGKP